MWPNLLPVARYIGLVARLLARVVVIIDEGLHAAKLTIRYKTQPASAFREETVLLIVWLFPIRPYRSARCPLGCAWCFTSMNVKVTSQETMKTVFSLATRTCRSSVVLAAHHCRRVLPQMPAQVASRVAESPQLVGPAWWRLRLRSLAGVKKPGRRGPNYTTGNQTFVCRPTTVAPHVGDWA